MVQSITRPTATPAAPKSVSAAKTADAPPAAAKPKAAPAVVEGAASVTAPMPGVIINVLVKKGDTVKVGDAVVILEAMKVENTLTASAGGKVVAVNCTTGDSVKKGDVLVQIG